MDSSSSSSSRVTKLKYMVWQQYQHLVDKTTPYILYRWIFLVVLACIYVLRLFQIKNKVDFFLSISIYMLGIYVFLLLHEFLSPRVDPDTLPVRNSDHIQQPFVRRLPEHKFWLLLVVGLCIALLLTFIIVSDWKSPSDFALGLFLYWTVYVFVPLTSARVRHMIKHKYMPFTYSHGKLRYKK